MATSKITRQPTGHIAPFGLRLQPELKARLEAEAEKAGRSLNAELVVRLERSLNLPDSQEETLDGNRMVHAVQSGRIPWSESAQRMFAELISEQVKQKLLPMIADKVQEQTTTLLSGIDAKEPGVLDAVKSYSVKNLIEDAPKKGVARGERKPKG